LHAWLERFIDPKIAAPFIARICILCELQTCQISDPRSASCKDDIGSLICAGCGTKLFACPSFAMSLALGKRDVDAAARV